MQENPYTAILDAMRTETAGRAKQHVFVGKVLKKQPLEVNVQLATGGFKLEADDLKINSWLKANQERTMQFDGKTQTTRFTSAVLEVGDDVLMVRSDDGETYYILCKLEGV